MTIRNCETDTELSPGLDSPTVAGDHVGGPVEPESRRSVRRPQSREEDLVNSLTHALGMLLSLIVLGIFINRAQRTGDPWSVLSFAIYGSSLFFAFFSSTAFHAFRNPKLKQVFQIMDHSAIYFFIAGTYTPIFLISMRNDYGLGMLALVWSLAVAGIAVQVIENGRMRKISILSFLVMGWIALIALHPLIRSVPAGLLLSLLTGAILYTVGGYFYTRQDIKFHHALWHLFVLAAAAIHILGMLSLLPTS